MAAQLKMRFPCGWGGKRKGAGRKPKGPRSSERHKTRPRLIASQPVHVTLRVAADLAWLRTRDMFRAIRFATLAVAVREDFRIVHLSVQGNHIHLICEAENRLALAAGVQAFEISAARHINRVASKRRKQPRRGTVFPDRYHSRILKSPTSVKRAINYVLNNWRHHREDHKRFAKGWLVDPFSSGISFTGWTELEDRVTMWQPSSTTYQALWVWRPKTWLLKHGWQRGGKISVHDVPASSASSSP